MAEQIKRLEIPYFEGVNSVVSDNISKKEEFRYAENARSKQIGTIEKREGQTQIGTTTSFETNCDLFNFTNTTYSGTASLYRIGSKTSAFSVNTFLLVGTTWTDLAGSWNNLCLLGDATTQYDITNPTGTTYRYTYDTTGTNPLLRDKLVVGNKIYINLTGSSAGNQGVFTLTGVGTNYFEVSNALGVVESNKIGVVKLLDAKHSHAIFDNKIFLTNGVDNNRYISSDGTTVVSAATVSVTNPAYNSPVANLVNYYKGRLYLADFFTGTTRNKNMILMSSEGVGLVSLVSTNATTGATTIEVSDTKYIYASDTLEVYSGSTLVTTLTVTAKTESSITVSATAADIKAGEELWIAGTFNGEKTYRWAQPGASGTTVKLYDTMKFSNVGSDEITMMANIGNAMIISGKNNMATWNGSNLAYLDGYVGCVSKRGYTKAYNTLYFVHYTGIYATSGDTPIYLSAKMQEYFQGATTANLENAVVGRKGLSVFFCIGDITLYNDDGSVYRVLPDVCLEYDIKQQNWFVHTNVPAQMMTTYVSSTNPDMLVMINADDSQTYEFLSGSSDNTKEITFAVSTSNITLSKAFEYICYPQELIVEAKAGSGIRAFVSLDDGQMYELRGSDGKKGLTIFRVTPPSEDVEAARCRRIRIAIKESSKGKCKLSRVALVYKETNEKENVRA